MVYPRQSRVTNGNLIHLIFNQMEDQPIFDAQLQTQDGGNSSDSKTITLSMKEEKQWRSQEMLMLNKETSQLTQEIMVFINNGTLFMLMSGNLNQSKEN